MNIRATLETARARLMYYLPTVIAAHLSDSGYRQGPIGASKPLKVWVPRDAQGRPTMEAFPLTGGYAVPQFMGFTSTGVILDTAGGGLETMDFADLPIEDLQALDEWMAQARDSGVFPGEQARLAA